MNLKNSRVLLEIEKPDPPDDDSPYDEISLQSPGNTARSVRRYLRTHWDSPQEAFALLMERLVDNDASLIRDLKPFALERPLGWRLRLDRTYLIFQDGLFVFYRM